MVQKSEFRAVEFFRKVRDEQAAMLAGKSHEEIIAFFSSFNKHSMPNKVLLVPGKARSEGNGTKVK